MFSIRIFSIKWRNLFAFPFAFPVGLNLAELPFNAIPASRVARSAERGLFKTSHYVAASPCFFLLSQKSAKIVSLVPRLPLGGRLRREAVVRGASCFLSESFQSSGATCSSFPLLSPLGKVAAKPPIEVCLKLRLMLRLPLASIKFCLQNFLRQKLSAATRLPPGGKLSVKQTDEGRNLFSIRIFSIKWRNLFAFPLLSPSGPLAELPFNAIPASMASSAAPIEPHCVFLKNRQSGGKNFLAAALIFNRCFRYSGNR